MNLNRASALAPDHGLLPSFGTRERYDVAGWMYRHTRRRGSASVSRRLKQINKNWLVSIAPNNATGNFTKIVQRLPVKIVVTPGQPLAKLLRVGMSVETTIHTGLENVVVDEQRRSSDRLIGH
jgi:hypothetical protein